MASTSGCSIALIMRSVICSAVIRNEECTEAITQSSSARISSS